MSSGDREYVDAFNILEKNTFSQGGQLMRKKKTHTQAVHLETSCEALSKVEPSDGKPDIKSTPKIGCCKRDKLLKNGKKPRKTISEREYSFSTPLGAKIKSIVPARCLL